MLSNKRLQSSGTTGMITSKHLLRILHYMKKLSKGFSNFMETSRLRSSCLVTFLPWARRISLIYMVEDLIKCSNHPESGFYLHNHDELIKNLIAFRQDKMLFWLSDLCIIRFNWETPIPVANTIIMETGGMKGKRKEMIREELHNQLCCFWGSCHSFRIRDDWVTIHAKLCWMYRMQIIVRYRRCAYLHSTW
jgi:hypothetical protein